MNEWKEKYVYDIKEAVEYSCITGTTKAIEKIIDKIYEDGFADGVADSIDSCEEPMNYSEMMQDLD